MSPQQIEASLDDIARSGGFTAKDAYFIRGDFRIELPDGDTLYTDEGLNYCCDCAESLVKRALQHLPAERADEHRVNLTNLSEEDSPMSCEECHAVLDYALSENGLFYELDHYSSIELTSPLRSGDAYAIARMVSALDTIEDEEDELTAELDMLDPEEEGDRERAYEIRREMAERGPSTRDQVLELARRALALTVPEPAPRHVV